MDTIEAIHGRRSIRSYTATLLERDQVESVLWDAAQAPPPFSGQVPWTFNVIQGVERIAALGVRAMEHARATRPDKTQRTWLDRPDFQIFWNAPVLIVISGELGDCNQGCPKSDAIRPCARPGNLLGWFADAMANHRGG